MKRAGRWLFNFGAAVSALLFVATVFGSWASYRPSLRRSAQWKFEGGAALVHGATNWGSIGGRFELLRVTWYPFDKTHAPYRTEGWNALGMKYESSPVIPRSARFQGYLRIRTLQVSYAWPASLSVLVMLAWLLLRMRRVHLPGACAVCGYDLRATPARCPECGAIQTAAKESAG